MFRIRIPSSRAVHLSMSIFMSASRPSSTAVQRPTKNHSTKNSSPLTLSSSHFHTRLRCIHSPMSFYFCRLYIFPSKNLKSSWKDSGSILAMSSSHAFFCSSS